MAAYVQDIITWTTAAGNKTATITPAVGNLLVVFCASTAIITIPTVTDDQGGIYDLVGTAARGASTSGGWAFIRTSLAKNVAHIVTLTTSGSDTGGGLDVIEVSGMLRAGGGAARQVGATSNIGVGGVPTNTLPGVALTANPVFAFLQSGDNVNTATNPTGYTQRQNLGFASPTAGMGIHTRDSGETTNLITWGGTETGNSFTIALELDISPPPPYWPHPHLRTIGPVLVPRRG